MSIKTTRHITRDLAITRIVSVYSNIAHRDYAWLESKSFEPDFRADTYCATVDDFGILHIDKWSDEMLEDKMDEPYFRFSMFENYIILREF